KPRRTPGKRRGGASARGGRPPPPPAAITVARAMPSAAIRLPPAHGARAPAHYRAALTARRARTALGFVVLAAALVLAAVAGEVDPHKFVANIHRLPAYIVGLAPNLSWKTLGADLAEWFWDLRHWLNLLLDTLLIAYLGTLMGATGAFLLCFSATANLQERVWARIASRPLLDFSLAVPDLVFP